MDREYVKGVYAKLAPFYDLTFGWMLFGRNQVVRYLNEREGNLLDVGIGTGIHLGEYNRNLKVIGIDISNEMLAKASARVEKMHYVHVVSLGEMDADNLDFPASSFQTVVAMYVLTVVENPQKVMFELERVCVPGGEVIIVNHFANENEGLLSGFEKLFEPLGTRLGWRTRFPMEELLCCRGLKLIEVRNLQPFGLFKMLRFVRQDDDTCEEDVVSETYTATA